MERFSKVVLPALSEQVEHSGEGGNIGGAPCVGAIVAAYTYAQ